MLLPPLSMKQSSSRVMLVLLFLAPLMLTGGLAAAAVESIALQEPEPPALTPAEIMKAESMYPLTEYVPEESKTYVQEALNYINAGESEQEEQDV